MGADPSFPLFPVVSLLATVLFILILSSSLVRRSWNLGVAFLCVWLVFENLTHAINAIIWADNADARLYVYCDVGALTAQDEGRSRLSYH